MARVIWDSVSPLARFRISQFGRRAKRNKRPEIVVGGGCSLAQDRVRVAMGEGLHAQAQAPCPSSGGFPKSKARKGGLGAKALGLVQL